MPKLSKAYSLIALLCSLLLSACGTVAAQPAPSPTHSVRPSPQIGDGKGDIKIGLIAPLIGNNSGYGTALRRGILLALDEAKTNGAFGNRKLVLIERNEPSDPEQAAQLFVDLVEREGVIALITTSNDTQIASQTELANAWRVPTVIPLANLSKISEKDDFIFSFVMSLEEQARYIAGFISRRDFTKVALLTEDNSYGQQGRAALLVAFAPNGTKLSLDENFNPEAKPEELRLLVTKLKELDITGGVIWANGANIVQLRRLMYELNYSPALFASDSVAFNSFGQNLGKLAENITVPQTFVLNENLPRQQDFAFRFKKMFNATVVDFPSGVAQAYDATQLLIEALKRPGATDNRDTLRIALRELNTYVGIIKTYQSVWKSPFSSKDLQMLTWRDGKLVKL